MQIIDAHHHLWAPNTPELDVGYVWIKDIGAMKPFGDPTPIQRDYLLDEFLAEPSPDTLQASVHVQADPKIPDPVAETAFVQRISDQSRHPIYSVGFADLTSKAFADQLTRHQAYPNLRGIRQIISYLPDRPDISFAPRNLLDDPLWRDNFARLADSGLRFDLQLYPEQMLQAADLLAAHPQIPVVVDHLGSPYDSSPSGLQLWATGMHALSQLPQVSVKLSGYAMFFGGQLTGPATQVTRDILKMFGANRTMFGSNFPVDSLHLRYPDIVSFIREITQDDEGAQQQVFGATAARFYAIPMG